MNLVAPNKAKTRQLELLQGLPGISHCKINKNISIWNLNFCK